jgi:hypothetical protein
MCLKTNITQIKSQIEKYLNTSQFNLSKLEADLTVSRGRRFDFLSEKITFQKGKISGLEYTLKELNQYESGQED